MMGSQGMQGTIPQETKRPAEVAGRGGDLVDSSTAALRVSRGTRSG